MKILIDPGHGGDKPGAVYGGEEEKEIALAVGLRCANVLRELGHDVFLTRDRDVGIPLPERMRIANEYKAQVFLSIHCNASTNDQVRGAETYYRDTEDELLAHCVQEALAAHTGMKDRGVFQDELRLKKRLAVLNNDKLPCALVEIGFLSNADDRKYMTENMQTIGEVLAHGVDWYTCIIGGVEKKNWPA